jgi:hypothetical protein
MRLGAFAIVAEERGFLKLLPLALKLITLSGSFAAAVCCYRADSLILEPHSSTYRFPIALACSAPSAIEGTAKVLLIVMLAATAGHLTVLLCGLPPASRAAAPTDTKSQQQGLRSGRWSCGNVFVRKGWVQG